MSTHEIQNIYSILTRMYPMKLRHVKTYDDLIALELSHFRIVGAFDYSRCVDITNVSHVRIESGWMTIKRYLFIVTKAMEYVNLSFFLEYPNALPYCSLPPLHIHQICLAGNITTPKYTTLHIEKPLVHRSNHFNFYPSLDMSTDATAILREVTLLNHTRDRYDTLHFHLWEGGDLSVVHMILKCLCGQREEWMTPYIMHDSQHMHTDDNTGKITFPPVHYDPWVTTERTTPIIPSFKNYCTKYAGKIVLHVNRKCASAAWYLMTYLIYAFAKKITRKTILINGVHVKVGVVYGIEINGYSLTSSGDAYGDNPLRQCKLFGKKYTVKFPSQFYKSSIEKRDINRFWLPNA